MIEPGRIGVGTERAPAASVVVPTYNRSHLLRLTLNSLAAQDMPVEGFEVIVADDGSADETPDVVRQFRERLRLRYIRQEDQGFRAAAARNAGAALAEAPILVFLDSGVQAGPGFVGSHVRRAAPRRVVLGYTYGSEPSRPSAGLRAAMAELPPAEVRDRYRDDEAFWDGRYGRLTGVDFDADRSPFPWTFLWSLNFSLLANDFWSVGGFDEEYQGWGMEDLELGYRLHKRGASFQMSFDAWGIESPHERDREANIRSNRRNIIRFLLKHADPVLELYLAWSIEDYAWSLEAAYDSLQEWTRGTRELAVVDEIEAALRCLPPGGVAAVLGSGGWRPGRSQRCAAFDFDPRYASPDGPGRGSVGCAIGLRTPLPDNSVDLVVVTSRLRQPWSRYARLIRAEAQRVGRTLWLSPQLDGDDAALPAVTAR